MLWWWTAKRWIGWMFVNWQLVLIAGLLVWLFVINNQKEAVKRDLVAANLEIENIELYSEQLIGTIDLQEVQIEKIILRSEQLKEQIDLANREVSAIKEETEQLISEIQSENVENQSQWLLNKAEDILERWQN